MNVLEALHSSELTNYVVKILRKYGISTIRDLLEADVENLSKITNLQKPSILSAKNEVIERYSPHPVQMSSFYFEVIEKALVYYKTGIHCLDLILGDDGFCGGCILEICGFNGVGKTQLCLTIALNFASDYGHHVFYIDTKAECLGSRIYEMLKSRSVIKSKMGQIMQQIKYQRTLSVYNILHIFEMLFQKLKENCPETNKIKLIVVDSVPALLLHTLENKQRLNGMCELSKLANLMHILSKKYFIIILFVNLLIPIMLPNLQGSENQEGTDNDTQHMDSKYCFVKPALGNYWLGVPIMRLAIESSRLSALDDISAFRDIRVLKSSFKNTGDICRIRITDSGINAEFLPAMRFPYFPGGTISWLL